MPSDLIITATMDVADVEKKAKQLESTISSAKLNNPTAGAGLAKNMDSAKLSTDAMFRVVQAMGGTTGRIAGQFKAILDSARMMKPVLDQVRSTSNGGVGSTAANVASNLGGGLLAGKAASIFPSRAEQLDIMKAAQLAGLSTADIGRFRIPDAAIKASDAATKMPSAFQNMSGSLGRFIRATDLSTKGLIKLGAVGALTLASWNAAISAWKSAAMGTGAMSSAMDVLDTKRRNRMYADESAPVADRRALMMKEIDKLAEERKLVQGVGGSSQARAFMEGATGITWKRLIPQFSGGAREAMKNAKPEDVAKLKEQFKTSGKDPSFWATKTLELSDRFDAVSDMVKTLDKKSKASVVSEIEPKSAKSAKSGVNIITDDITRIGGSIGGGMDAQRAMANSLSSIDRAVAAIKSSVSGKSSQYI